MGKANKIKRNLAIFLALAITVSGVDQTAFAAEMQDNASALVTVSGNELYSDMEEGNEEVSLYAVRNSNSADGHDNHRVCCGTEYYGHSNATCSHTSVQWNAWTENDNLPGNSDCAASGVSQDGMYYFYLTDNVTISDTWEPVSGIVLCLNGKTITMTGSDSVITIQESHSFTLTDCKGSGKITNGSGKLINKYRYGGGVYSAKDSTFTMYGGNITGNESGDYGGGVYNNNSTFTVYSGSITYNQATNEISNNHYSGGGGVYNNNSTFTMYGGSIANNTASAGGGVHNYRSTFIMYGGSISSNLANTQKNLGGGGVSVSVSSEFFMYGGSITDNRAPEPYINGGGVYNENLFAMYGGSITNNSAGEYGGGVCSTKGFLMYGGSITDNTAHYGGGVATISESYFKILGSVDVSNNKNTDNRDSNVHLDHDNDRIIVTADTEVKTTIGVSKFYDNIANYEYEDALIAEGDDSNSTVESDASKKYTLTADDAAKFKYEGTQGFEIVLDAENNKLVLKEALIKPHMHTWTYSASENVIKAYCTNTDSADSCNYQGEDNALTLTLNAENASYDGSEHGAEVTDSGSFAATTGAIQGNVQYRGKGDTNYTESETAPNDAGNYTACLTVTYTEEGQSKSLTAIRDFTIEKVVSEKVLTDISLKGEPRKAYIYGESFDMTGINITALYSDDSTEDVTAEVSCSELEIDTTEVELTYAEGSVTKSILLTGITINYLEADDTAVISGECGENGWYHGEVTISAPIGWQIASVALKKAAWSASLPDTVATESETNTVTYSLKDGAGRITDLKSVEVRIDDTAPSGSITIDKDSWNCFWNNITFGKFFKETQIVTVKGEDALSGIDRIYYYEASSEKSVAELDAMAYGDDGWQELSINNSGEGSFDINPDARLAVYVKLVDLAGNTLYMNSDGVVLDAVIPTVMGVKNGDTYYEAKTVTVKDNVALDKVTLNGETVILRNNQFTITVPESAVTYTLAATDIAGNSISVVFSIEPEQTDDESGTGSTDTESSKDSDTGNADVDSNNASDSEIVTGEATVPPAMETVEGNINSDEAKTDDTNNSEQSIEEADAEEADAKEADIDEAGTDKPWSGEPKTGETGLPMATLGMIAGLTYLTELFMEKRGIYLGMTETQKNRAISYLIGKAKGRNKLIRYGAIAVIFVLLVFYHSIGKAVEFDSEESKKGVI